MMCHKTGLPPISTIGLGLYSVSSRRRVPIPPQRITTGIEFLGFVEFIEFFGFIAFIGFIEFFEFVEFIEFKPPSYS